MISPDVLPNETRLFALSYPATEDRYDFDHLTSTETPLIAIGTLRRPSNPEAEVFTMECDELLIPMNGASGGAVMALVDGTIYYAGLMIRSTQSSRLIHFINAARISETIGWIVDKLKPCNLDYPAYMQHADA